jgi:hypothetical protein
MSSDTLASLLATFSREVCDVTGGALASTQWVLGGPKVDFM